MFGLRSKKSPQKGNRRNSARLFHRKPSFECLEGRQMLSAGNLFAEFVGILNQPGDVEHIAVSIAPEKLGITGDKAFLGFQTQSRGGGSFDPAALQIRSADGTLVKPEFSVANLPGSTDSVVLVQLGKGNYTLDVSGTLGARSQFQVDVYLVGDVNGDHAVRTDDLDLIRQSYGSKSGGAAYNLAADANLDGRINAMDLSLARRNQASSQPVVSGNQLLSLGVAPYGDVAAVALASQQTAPISGGTDDSVAGVVPTSGYDPDRPMRFYESTTGIVQAMGQDAIMHIPGNTGDTATLVMSWTYREAGYNNSLGYYYTNAPGTLYTVFASGDVPNKTGIDPNKPPVVKTVTVDCNTDISFFMVQNGNVGSGNNTWYATDTMNADNYAHFSGSGGSFSVEDLSPTLSNPLGYMNDADFNDVVFTTTTWIVDIDTDSNNDGTINHATDDPVEEQYPGACLARYSGHSEELAEVDIRSIGVTPAQSGQWSGKLTFSGEIRVWRDSARTTEITSGSSWDLYNTSQVPTTVYVEGETDGQSSLTWTIYVGAVSAGSDTVDFTLLTSTLTVTNMAPATIDPSELLLDPFVIVSMEGSDFERGGDVAQQDGDWVYTPHDTTYVASHTNAPWDPYHPYGDGPSDGAWGGAAFFAAVTDENGHKLKVNVSIDLSHVQHEGYTFTHADASGENSGDEWVESTAQGGMGGLLLAGGGTESVMTDDGTANGYSVFSWFIAQSFGESYHGGNVVVIANNHGASGVTAQVNAFIQYGAKSVDAFNFDVDTNGDISAAVEEIVADITTGNAATDGKGLGHEFIDKLQSAEAVYFMGGDQWPYVQLLTPRDHLNRAAAIISGGNNAGTVIVGGTSAGMAILGNYVFTAQYIHNDSLLSSDILANYKTSKFYDVVDGPSIADNVLSLNALDGVVTETHFTDPDEGKDPDSHSDGHHIYRLGRFASFLGSLLLDEPDGLEELSANGLAVDNATALTISGDGARVWGMHYVYFASADNASLDGNDKLAMTDVYMRWFGRADGTFDYSNAWVDDRTGTHFAVYSLQGGVLTKTSGYWASTFPTYP